MRLYECCIKPSSGEIIDAAVPLPPESAALITGTVLDTPERPLPDALVLLFEKETEKLLLSTVTDDLGRFYLGPVRPDTLYVLRVQASGVHTRILELKV